MLDEDWLNSSMSEGLSVPIPSVLSKECSTASGQRTQSTNLHATFLESAAALVAPTQPVVSRVDDSASAPSISPTVQQVFRPPAASEPVTDMECSSTSSKRPANSYSPKAAKKRSTASRRPVKPAAPPPLDASPVPVAAPVAPARPIVLRGASPAPSFSSPPGALPEACPAPPVPASSSAGVRVEAEEVPVLSQKAAPVVKRFRKKKRRKFFSAVDYGSLHVPVPAVDKLTVIVRPTSSKLDLGSLHQGIVFKQLSAVCVPDAIRNIRGGAIAVDFPLSANVHSLLEITKLTDTPVKVSLPTGQISSVGVLHGLHPDVEESDFLAEVSSDPPVLGLRRLAKPGTRTWVVKIVFQGTTPPKKVRYAGRSFRVSSFKPKPRQCANCFGWRHATESCIREPCCPRCGDQHQAPCLASEARCVNCGGSHSADNLNCQARAFETKVMEFRAKSSLPVSEAKSAVHKAAKTYAAAAKQAPNTTGRESPKTSPTCEELPSKAVNFVAEVVTAVIYAAKSHDYEGLFDVLAGILQAFTGSIASAGALKELVAEKTKTLVKTPSTQ